MKQPPERQWLPLWNNKQRYFASFAFVSPLNFDEDFSKEGVAKQQIRFLTKSPVICYQPKTGTLEAMSSEQKLNCPWGQNIICAAELPFVNRCYFTPHELLNIILLNQRDWIQNLAVGTLWGVLPLIGKICSTDSWGWMAAMHQCRDFFFHLEALNITRGITI